MNVTPEQIETLAEKVHEAWAAEKIKQGFADHAFTKDPGGHGLAVQCEVCGETLSNKHHADMLPYADLADHVKEYDRATVRGVLGALAETGYEIVRKDELQRLRAFATADQNAKTRRGS